MKTGRRILQTVFLLALIGGAGVGGYYAWGALRTGSTLASDSIPLVEVRQGDFRKTISSIGELKASRSAMITSPFNGKITRLIPEGTRVQADDPIIWLDTDDLVDRLRDEEARMLLAEKDLDAAKEDYQLQELQNEYNLQSELARVELAEQRLQDAEQRFESERILVERRISPQTRLEEARLSLLQATVELRNANINLRKTEENLASNLRVKQSGIERAELEIERIQRRIDDFQDRIDRSTIRSPENGEVSYMRIWKSGQMAKVAEGDNVFPRLTLMEIPDRSEMLAVIPVNELDIANVDVGQPAIITLDALPGEQYKGKVTRKSVVALDAATSRRGNTSSTGPREFEVEIKLENSDSRFFQGMTAAAEIRILELDDALMVPLQSLTLNIAGEVGVYRRGDMGYDFIPVDVKDTNALFAYVTAPLEPGERLYTRNPTVSSDEARELAVLALRRVGRGVSPEQFIGDDDLDTPEVAQTPGQTSGRGSTPR
ncbi:MAG: efflux RND transporter periplasmic adaptor subunit [Candidatus Sumerlaeia bacterium]|nr:efflux RND transporter periplasmic adaptor subunit [Candidatus Sumerlaeia bacterium]